MGGGAPWGSIIVAPGYADPLLYASGGNPYGTAIRLVGGGTGAGDGDRFAHDDATVS